MSRLFPSSKRQLSPCQERAVTKADQTFLLQSRAGAGEPLAVSAPSLRRREPCSGGAWRRRTGRGVGAKEALVQARASDTRDRSWSL